MEQTDLLRLVIDVLEGLEIRYAVAGSIASSAYGEPRYTQDIDVVVIMSDEQTGALCRSFPPPDFYVSLEAARQAVAAAGQFNILHAASGYKIDIIMAPDNAWGASEMRRRQHRRLLPDREGNVASPEDVIIGKMLYYQEGQSDKHLRDIAGILKTSGDLVDLAYIDKWAGELGLSEAWQAIRAGIKPNH